MNAHQNTRTFLGLAVLGLLAGTSTQALATISDPSTRQTEMVGTNVAAPETSFRLDADSKSKEPLIRVAPVCAQCRYDGG